MDRLESNRTLDPPKPNSNRPHAPSNPTAEGSNRVPPDDGPRREPREHEEGEEEEAAATGVGVGIWGGERRKDGRPRDGFGSLDDDAAVPCYDQ